MAERRNPKRAFSVCQQSTRWAHSRATLSHAAGLQTACQPVPLDTDLGPVLFIGMAETAVGLGAGVFVEVRHQHRESVYLTSTRHPVDGTLLCEFKEEHSHATDHLILSAR
ncbi:phosphoribosyltransferase domain-containing protein [Escherichia coli]|nr:phosphoribosyltransferase domain-containing protein [Escherichia coli]